MEPHASSGRKCRSCNELFWPLANNKTTQSFCSQAACRKASKAHSNARWRRHNPGYDSGPEQVEGVRKWRAAHPGYSRGKKRPDPPPALQDFAANSLQVLVNPRLTRHSASRTVFLLANSLSVPYPVFSADPGVSLPKPVWPLCWGVLP